MSLNNKGAEAKYNVKLSIDGSTGVLFNGDSENIPCHIETQLRVEVSDVGATNEIQIYGRIRSSNLWHYIATITGPVTGIADISTYDFLRYFHTVADGVGTLTASGFIYNKPPSAVEISGGVITAIPSGLRVRLKITNTTVSDVASQVPAVPLTARNSIIIENNGLDPIYIGESNVSNSGANEGWKIDPSSIFSTDITDLIQIYAIAPIGKTVTLKIMELA